MTWLFYLFSAWILSLGINYLIIRRGKGNNKIIRRLGGAGVILSFLVVMLFSEVIITEKILALLIGSGAILIFGILDDFKNINWKIQLGFQLSLALLIIFFGFQIDFISIFEGSIWQLNSLILNIFGLSISLIGSAILILWMILIINAVNWADGVDGLAVSIGIIAAAAILFVSLRPEVNQPAVAIMAMIFIGGLLGLSWLNFPPAKIIAGTSGSYFIGFFLASLAVLAGTKIATLMIVLALPILDTGWVVYNRIKSGQCIFKKDIENRHFHYQLKKIGWSDRKIFISYFSFLFLMFLLGVFFSGENLKILILIFEAVIILLILIWADRKAEAK